MGSVVFATFGTLGSIHPYLAVALRLQARGHQVTLASSASYQTKIEAYGLRFRPVRPDRTLVTGDAETSRRSTDLKKGSRFAIENLLRYVQQTYDDLVAACDGADLFISHPAAFCAPVVAEKLRLRWLSVALAPATLFSAHDPPVLPSMPWLAKIPRVAGLPHRLIFRMFQAATRRWMRPLDDLRQRIGLPASRKHPFFDGMFSPFGTLGLFSSVLAQPQPDWPTRTRVTGFPFLRQDERLVDPKLAEFLAAGDPPIVFTLGSNVVREAGGFYQASLEAALRLGRRAILLTGDDPRNQPEGELPASIHVAAYAPYSAVFPAAAAVVHQGGIGTLGEAMAAGAPMLIVPHVHDQPDNAYRAVRLGVARSESRDRYSGPTAAGHLHKLISEPQYRLRAEAVQQQLAAEDGIGDACAAIEAALRVEVAADA